MVGVLAKLILNIIINLHVAYRYNNPAPKSDKSNNLGFFFRKLRFWAFPQLCISLNPCNVTN